MPCVGWALAASRSLLDRLFDGRVAPLVATLLPAGTLHEVHVPVAQVLALPSVLAVAAMPVQVGVNWRAVLLVLWLVGVHWPCLAG